MEQFTEDKVQFQKEQDQLLKTILNYRFFNPWKNLTKYADTNKSLRQDSILELYVTSTCNQTCEYCYLQKHPELYPKECNNPDTILHNLNIFLKYCLAENYCFPELSIFSGDIWTSEFGWSVLETIYQYVEKGLQIGRIMMPSNCSFVNNDLSLQKMQKIINKFNNIGCRFIISVSVDGKIIDESGRPRNDPANQYTDEFYAKLGAFAANNHFLFHPMISAQNVKYWKENYRWWEQYLNEYGFTNDDIMTLEVRDGNWTNENIKDYCDFLVFSLDRELNIKCNGDPKEFCKFLTGQPTYELTLPGYAPWLLHQPISYPGCSIADHLTVRLGDLAICPCHRTAYKQYLYGYFVVENDLIVDIKAVNPVIATHILMSNILYSTPLCDVCPIKSSCLKGCYGAQLEYGKDLLIPLSNVCKFFKNKEFTILKYYREHGIIDALKNIGPYEYYSDNVAELLLLNDNVGETLDELGTL